MESTESRIGYLFHDRTLLQEALTHASYRSEQGLEYDYNRLEYLGDAVLEIIVTVYLFKTMPDANEGTLTKKRAELVCENALSYCAKKMKLDKDLLMGKGAKEHDDAQNSRILCNIFESVLGAVFLDGGFPAAKKYVEEHLFAMVEELPKGKVKDAKSMLQEMRQAKGLSLPEYRTVKEEGPPNQRIFYVEMYLDGELISKANDVSKKKAEQKAAALALSSL